MNEPKNEAYDLKELLVSLKAEGLDFAEDAAEKIYIGLMNWLVASALKSKTPFDDIIVAVRAQMDLIVLAQIDKIDGKIDEK